MLAGHTAYRAFRINFIFIVMLADVSAIYTFTCRIIFVWALLIANRANLALTVVFVEAFELAIAAFITKFVKIMVFTLVTAFVTYCITVA